MVNVDPVDENTPPPEIEPLSRVPVVKLKVPRAPFDGAT